MGIADIPCEDRVIKISKNVQLMKQLRSGGQLPVNPNDLEVSYWFDEEQM